MVSSTKVLEIAMGALQTDMIAKNMLVVYLFVSSILPAVLKRRKFGTYFFTPIKGPKFYSL